jgi:general secretion pathway protein C
MLVNRSSISRVALPQTSAEWEQVFARCVAAIAKVPLSTWQFLARFLLVLSLSISLARLFWLVFPTPAIPVATVAIPTAAVHADSNNSGVNIAQLKTLAIFGKAEAPKQEQPAVIETQATVTQLNLILVGLIVSSDENSARAMIASGDKQDLYAVNAPLPVGNNVTLSKIMNDRVIINNNGQYESLWLYQNDPNAPPISQASAPPVAAQQIIPPQATPYPSGRPGPELEMQSPQPDKGSTDPGVAEVSRNLSDVLAMSIQRENGQVIGYKIRPGRDAEKFKSLGLQTDDIVTAINGMPLTNPAKIMEVYKNMGNTTSASLEIKRGGSVITVDVVLQ